MGQIGHQIWMGHMGHGSRLVTCWPNTTRLPITNVCKRFLLSLANQAWITLQLTAAIPELQETELLTVSMQSFYLPLAQQCWCAILIFCPSVCPSVTLRYFFSPIILVFPVLNIFTKFRLGHPNGGVEYRWGIYVENGTRYGHSYYGTVIGNHTRSIEPWHFRRPSVTFEGHFGGLRTMVTLCAQLTRDMLAIAKFLVVTSALKPNICSENVVEQYIRSGKVHCTKVYYITGHVGYDSWVSRSVGHMHYGSEFTHIIVMSALKVPLNTNQPTLTVWFYGLPCVSLYGFIIHVSACSITLL